MPSIPKDVSVAEAIASFARIEPVRLRLVSLTDAIGLRLAEDVVARRPVPAVAMAARNGYAVAAAGTSGASPGRPRKLGADVQTVESGMPMPKDTDAVLPMGSVTSRGGDKFATHKATAGSGVALPGSIAAPGEIIARQGSKITFSLAMSCAACGVCDVQVRQPVVDLVFNSPGMPRPGDHHVAFICSAIRGSGSRIGTLAYAGGDPAALRAALLDSSGDIITVVGGMGDGPGDTTMSVIAEIGEAVFSGVRLRPGGTTGFGLVEGKPVFASPGRLPEMIAANIILSWHFARRAFGRPPLEPNLVNATLLEAIPPLENCAQIILVHLEDGRARPLLGDPPSPRDIARANGSVFLPEGSPGHAAGQVVPVYRIGITM